MSLSQTPSSLPLPATVITGEPHEKDDSPEKNQDLLNDQASEKSSTVSLGGKSSEKKNSIKKPAPPVVRQRLMKREIGESDSLMVRPAIEKKDSPEKTSQQSESQATLPNSPRTNKENSLERMPKEPKSEEDRMPSSRPTLRRKRSEPIIKVLTTEQQLENDLIDLIDNFLIKNNGLVKDEISVGKLTPALQKYLGKSSAEKVSITDLMMNIFSADMKATDAWKIAEQVIDKIKKAHAIYYADPSDMNSKNEKEANDLLDTLITSFANSFFQISGDNVKNSLPDRLQNFLIAVDYRKIRFLLSTDTGINMKKKSSEDQRKSFLKTILLTAFLDPLIMKEFDLGSIAKSGKKTALDLIRSLYMAFMKSAPAILADSSQYFKKDIDELMLKRRQNDFKQNSQGYKADANSNGEKSPRSGGSSLRLKPSSPNRLRKIELNNLLKKAIKRIAPAILSEVSLQKIRRYNDELALSAKAIDHQLLYQSWLSIINENDPESPAINVLKEMLAIEIDRSNLERELVEVDLFTKLAAIEKSGQPITVERAKRLSSNLPLDAPPDSTTSRALLSSSSSITVSPASPIINRRNVSQYPASPTRHTQHKRSRTADAILPAERMLSSGITVNERQMLLRVFPDLLLDAVKNAAIVKTSEGEKWKPNPLKSIRETGRAKFMISLNALPRTLKEKVSKRVEVESDSMFISHAELWKLMMMDALVESPAGKKLLAGRAEALRAIGNSVTATELTTNDPDEHKTKMALTEKMQPQVDATLKDIFQNGFTHSGLPDELLAALKIFDNKLHAWAKTAFEMSPESKDHDASNVKIPEIEIDVLRSAMAFDLLITRLIYPLSIGRQKANTPVAQTRFGEAIRKSIKPIWDGKLFNDFKTMKGADATGTVAVST